MQNREQESFDQNQENSEAKTDLSLEKKAQYIRQFVAREDDFAILKPSPTRPAYNPARRPITEEDLRRHLTPQGPHIGIYFMKPGNEMIRHAVYDLDDHEGEGTFAEMQEAGKKIYDELRKAGYIATPFRSGGGRGIHLWLVWQEPQMAADIRHMMQSVLAALGYKDGTGGIKHGEVEVFPKQNRVAHYGSLVALPLGRKSVPLDVETFKPVGE